MEERAIVALFLVVCTVTNQEGVVVARIEAKSSPLNNTSRNSYQY